MRKNLKSKVLLLAVMTVAAIALLCISAGAYTSGYYTYEVYDGEAIITGCDTSVSGVIAIPDNLGGYPVTHINYDAFQYCHSITGFYVSERNNYYSAIDGVLYDKYQSCLVCFPDGKTVSSFTVPDTVFYIGNDAFEACTFLTAVTIPNSVESIGDRAFQHCTSLTAVTIPDSVTSIGDYAFYGCTSLTDVTIGDSVKTISSYAFAYCASLTNVTIPDSVIFIGECAFQYCTSLTGVTIGNSVRNIGSSAFQYCTSLTGVTIGNSVRNIGGSAFQYCTNLIGVVIPNSVFSIGDYAFEWCKSLTDLTISNGVVSIGNSAFHKCITLTAITIPDSVTSIGDQAFLATAYYTNSNNWKNGGLYIGKHLIKAEGSPSGNFTVKGGTMCIADFAFSGCYRLTGVTIPDSVTSIGLNAFYNCSSLTAVTIPDSVTSIGDGAFYKCSSLTAVTIGNSVTSIGDWAFSGTAYYNNSSNWENDVLYIGKYLIKAKDTLSGSYTVKDGTRCIGDYAFYYCTSLTTVTIPDSVTSIGNGAFYGCTSLTDVTIGNSVTSIGSYAFYGCTSLTAVTIPDSVTYIGGGAFVGCNLTDVTIGNGVTFIGDQAFAYCSFLTAVTIPDSVTSIGYGVFDCCENLQSITLPFVGGSAAHSDCLGFLFCSDGRLNNDWVPVSLKTVILSDICTLIADDAFKYCPYLTNVTIGNGVTSIGDGAFYACDSLSDVTIGNSVTTIGYFAFEACTSLTDVHYLGTQEQWDAISINDYNDPLLNATLHFAEPALSKLTARITENGVFAKATAVPPADGKIVFAGYDADGRLLGTVMGTASSATLPKGSVRVKAFCVDGNGAPRFASLTTDVDFFFPEDPDTGSAGTVFTTLGASYKYFDGIHQYYVVNAVEGSEIKTLNVDLDVYNSTLFGKDFYVASGYSVEEHGFVDKITNAESYATRFNFTNDSIEYEDGVLTINGESFVNDNIKVYIYDRDDGRFAAKSVSALKNRNINVGSEVVYVKNAISSGAEKKVISIFASYKDEG